MQKCYVVSFGLCGVCANNGSGVRIAELEEGGENFVTGCTLNDQEGSVEEVGITLYALSGTPTSGTMTAMGRIMHKSWVILIDSGSTHNFVDTLLFSQLHIPMDTSQVLEVKVANGEVLRTQGLCEAVSLCLQGHQFMVQLHVLPMGEV